MDSQADLHLGETESVWQHQGQRRQGPKGHQSDNYKDWEGAYKFLDKLFGYAAVKGEEFHKFHKQVYRGSKYGCDIQHLRCHGTRCKIVLGRVHLIPGSSSLLTPGGAVQWEGG